MNDRPRRQRTAENAGIAAVMGIALGFAFGMARDSWLPGIGFGIAMGLILYGVFSRYNG